MDRKRVAATVGFALLGWVLCGTAMGIGRALFGLRAALVLHALAAPVIFAAVSTAHHRLFSAADPRSTAAAFLAIAAFMDVFVVALLIERSFAMFSSFLGTWLPFALIFSSTYAGGVLVRGPRFCRGTKEV